MYEIGEEEIEAVARVIRSRKLFRYNQDGQGEADRFEQEWAKKIGVKHTLLVNSGTSALVCGLVGLGVAPGDEVIVPGYTFIATALAPLAIGAVPVLAEVDAGLMLDPTDVEKKITPRTRAIIPVHMNGHVVDLDPILRLAEARGIPVLEDCCQCVGGQYRGRRVGSLGQAGAYSFNFFKNISAGEGGAVVFPDRKAHQRARIFHDGGCAWRADAKDLDVPIFAGENYRFDEIRAAILRVQARRLDGILQRLRERWRKLREHFAEADHKSEAFALAPVHDPEGDCGASLYLRLASREAALAFAEAARARALGAGLPLDSGRHVYRNWEALMQRRGAYHPARDPLRTTEAGKAQTYAPEMLPRTLEHLARTVSIPIQLSWNDTQLHAAAQGYEACLKEARPKGKAAAAAKP